MRLERFGVTESHHRSSGDRIAITAYLGKGDAFDQAFPSPPPHTPTRMSGLPRARSCGKGRADHRRDRGVNAFRLRTAYPAVGATPRGPRAALYRHIPDGSVPGPAVDILPHEVHVAGVPSRFFQHVDKDPAQTHTLTEACLP